MRSLNWARQVLAILATALLTAAAVTCLPDDPYQRYSTLQNTIQARIRWIYERIHEDPTPIDVAVFGSSRWGAAVNSPRLQADLAALGRPLATVNFSLPENGRDLHSTLLNETLSAKHPRLIVIGIIEKPSRFGHPAYKYIAPVREAIDPVYLGNLNYLSTLAYLPYRQMRLFAARSFPDVFGLPARPDPSHYAGSNNDNAFAFRTDDGKVIDREHRVDRGKLLAQVARYERGVHPPLLGRRFAAVEFGDDRSYVTLMAEAARQRGIKVVFLFLPYFTGPSDIQERKFYERYGPILDASFLSTHDEFYADVAHVNQAGATALTDWLAQRLVPLLPKPGPATRRGWTATTTPSSNVMTGGAYQSTDATTRVSKRSYR